MKAFLDTSVLTSYYCPEPRSLAVQRALDLVEHAVISPLVEMELLCVVSRKHRAGDLDIPSARRIFTEFRRHIAEARYMVTQVQAADYALAGRWIEGLSSSLRSVDALHLAVAANHGLVLVTADRELAKSAGIFGVKRKLIS